MSNWPPTCAQCGAPIMGGRCPRCRNEQRPLGGKIVYSANPGAGGGGGPLVIPVVSAGAATGFGTTVTIPNITILPGWTLFVYAGITGDTSETTRSTVTWGGISMSPTSQAYNFDNTLYADAFILYSALGGTGNIVATNADPQRDVAFAVADTIGSLAGSSYQQSWFSFSASPTASASISIAIDPTDIEAHVIWAKDAVVDPGVWGGGAVGGQGLAIGGTFGPGYISTGFGPGGFRATIVPTKALSPSAAWHWHTTGLQGL